MTTFTASFLKISTALTDGDDAADYHHLMHGRAVYAQRQVAVVS
jgi:hypothetical protein